MIKEYIVYEKDGMYALAPFEDFFLTRGSLTHSSLEDLLNKKFNKLSSRMPYELDKLNGWNPISLKLNIEIVSSESKKVKKKAKIKLPAKLYVYKLVQNDTSSCYFFNSKISYDVFRVSDTNLLMYGDFYTFSIEKHFHTFTEDGNVFIQKTKGMIVSKSYAIKNLENLRNRANRSGTSSRITLHRIEIAKNGKVSSIEDLIEYNI